MQTIEEYKAYTKQLEGEVGKWHHAYDALMIERNQLVNHLKSTEKFLEAHKDELEEPKPDTRPQAEIDEENRKAKIRRLSSLERKEFLGNVKSIAGNDGFKTKWEKILSQFILNNLAPMNEEINVLRNFAQGVSQRLEKAERSAREQDNHHYYKIFADGVKTLLEAL